MNALNNQQTQKNMQNDSFQAWLDRMIEGHKRMATDEKFRQEVASRATSRSTSAEIQQMVAEEIAKHNSLKAQNLQC